MSNKHRTVVVGCGGRGKEHLKGLADDPRAVVVALVDPVPEAATACRKELGLECPIYGDIEDALAEQKPEIAVIALWTGLHRSALEACVAHGVKLVMCEKPIAATWDESCDLAELAERSGTIFTLCHQRRFANGNLAVRQLLKEGRFGKIERMEMFSPPHLLDCGTHTFDQAMSFNEESPAKSVLGAVDLSRTISYFQVVAECEAIGEILFENGVRATLRVGKEDMDLWAGIRVFGAEGLIEVLWDGEVRRAIVYGDPSWKMPAIDDSREAQMVGVVRNAIDALEQGIEPELSYRKAMRAAEAIFALYESALRRKRVTLPLPRPLGNPLRKMLDQISLQSAPETDKLRT